jgi:hypothetical protein
MYGRQTVLSILRISSLAYVYTTTALAVVGQNLSLQRDVVHVHTVSTHNRRAPIVAYRSLSETCLAVPKSRFTLGYTCKISQHSLAHAHSPPPLTHPFIRPYVSHTQRCRIDNRCTPMLPCAILHTTKIVPVAARSIPVPTRHLRSRLGHSLISQ